MTDLHHTIATKDPPVVPEPQDPVTPMTRFASRSEMTEGPQSELITFATVLAKTLIQAPAPEIIDMRV